MGQIEIVAGGGNGGDGALATEAQLVEPFAVEFDMHGNMYIAELMGHRIRRIGTDGRITTIAGKKGMPGDAGDHGAASGALVNGPHEVRLRPGTRELFIADTWSARVRKINLGTGIITTVLGTGTKGFSGDGGPAHGAQVGEAYAIAFDAAGRHLYLADLDNFRVRRVDLQTNIVTTVAGNGVKGVPRDGEFALEEPLMSPRAVAVDRQNNLYILERGGHAIRKVDAGGRISTIVGTGEAGYSGDHGPARSAQLRGPKHLVADSRGDLIIADTENHVIRRYVAATQRIEPIAGTGREGNGPGEFNRPHGVCLDRNGRLFIADSYNHRIVRWG